MRNVMRVLGIMAILLVFAFSVHADDKRGITNDTIKIGLIADTTGPVADFGKFLKMGCEDYFSYVNEKGGIHGRKLQLIHENDEYSVPKAIVAFEKLVFKDEVLAIMHCGGSPQAMALMQKIAENRVPVIPPGIFEKMYDPHQRYFFVFGSTYADQARSAVDFMMHDLKAKEPKLGVVYVENDVGRVSLDATKKRLDQYGLKPAAEVELSAKSIDASSQVMSLKRAGVDYVVLFQFAPGAINFLKAAQKFDYYPTYLANVWCADDSILKATGSAAKNGYYAASIFGAWHDDTPGAKELRLIAEKYGHSSPKLPTLYIQGYTDSDLVAEGLRRAGREVTVESFVNAMETFKEYSCKGMLSPMTYTSTSHLPSPYVKMFKGDVEKGILISATDWIKVRDLK